MQLHFYYDVVCPYAYMASTRVEALADAHDATLVWKPFLLGGVFKLLESPAVPAHTWAPSKARLGLLDIDRQAELWGVPLHRPGAHPRRTVGAMRLIVGAPEAVRPALSRALFRAYWVEGRDVADPAVLAGIGAEHGVSAGPGDKEALFVATREAFDRGVFGAPSFVVVDGPHPERLAWGNDRMHLLTRALGGGPGPRPGAGGLGRKTGEGPVLRVFHDFSSPFSYLGSTQVARLAAEHGARVEWTPILLGALFREIGTPDVPMFAMNASKQRYIAFDLDDWAAWWGVPFTMPAAFPLRTVAPLRVALVEPKTTPHIYRACWGEGRDIGDPSVLRDVLDDAGFDGAALLAATQDPAVKARLKANNDAAVAAGVCGVPSFSVELAGAQPLLVWGQDRLDMVGRMLDGWRPVAER